ncbi:MAG: ECF-type sigma factor [Planctomycetota bacterium]
MERTNDQADVDRAHLTTLVHELGSGRRDKADDLLAAVYGELRKLAAHYLHHERRGHTLQPTALVHEAYLRLIDQSAVDWQGRAHFFAVAAQMLRRVLVDHARARGAEKRGGGRRRVELHDVWPDGRERPGLDLLDLDDALVELGQLHDRQRQVVELRFFGGLTIAETANVLGIAEPTVKKDWRTARAWLSWRLSGDETPYPPGGENPR